jgi:hypothetical protein
MSHKPFNPSTAEHQKFLLNTMQKLKAIKNKVNVDKEISIIKDQILDI